MKPWPNLILYSSINLFLRLQMKIMDACEWCTVEVLRIFTQDMGLNQFRFSLKQHGPSHLVKVKLERTHGHHSLQFSFVNWHNYVLAVDEAVMWLDSSFAPILQDGYFHISTWLDEPFYKSMSLVQPYNPRNGNSDRQYFNNIS